MRLRVILTGTPAPNGFDTINLLNSFWPKKYIALWSKYFKELSEMNSVSKAQQREQVTELTDSLKPFSLECQERFKAENKIPFNYQDGFISKRDLRFYRK